MRLGMKEARRGSEDGHTVHRYYKDCIYTLAHSLACDFLRKGWAVEIKGEKAA